MRPQLRHVCSQNPLASFSCLWRPFSYHHSQESWNPTRAIGQGDRVDLFPNLAHLGSLPQHPPTYLERARLPAIPALGKAIASLATHACWLAPRVGMIRRPLAVRGDPWHRCVVPVCSSHLLHVAYIISMVPCTHTYRSASSLSIPCYKS